LIQVLATFVFSSTSSQAKGFTGHPALGWIFALNTEFNQKFWFCTESDSKVY
jgi:hypothetical protein